MKSLIPILLALTLEISIPLGVYFHLTNQPEKKPPGKVIPSKRYRYCEILKTPKIFVYASEEIEEAREKQLSNSEIKHKSIAELISLTEPEMPTE